MERLGKGHALVRRSVLAQNGLGPDVVVEGSKLVADLLALGLTPHAVVVREDRAEDLTRIGLKASVPTYSAESRLFVRMAATATPQGVLALFPKPHSDLPDLASPGACRIVLALDGVQDPTNVGALIRSAAGLGARSVLVGAPSAHPFGARAVRASAGAVYRLPVVETGDLEKTLDGLGIASAVARAEGGRPAASYAWDGGPWALIVGNEGHGPSVKGRRSLTVPLRGGVESLNVAVAGALLLAELLRLSGARTEC